MRKYQSDDKINDIRFIDSFVVKNAPKKNHLHTINEMYVVWAKKITSTTIANREWKCNEFKVIVKSEFYFI